MAARRLERLRDAAFTPASGSPDRGAGRQPDAHKNTDAASPFAGQATGELRRLADYLEREAARLYEVAGSMNQPGQMCPAIATAEKAADIEGWAAMVRGALSEPRAQSDEREDRRCRHISPSGRRCCLGTDHEGPHAS